MSNPIETLFCKKHLGVALRITNDGEYLGSQCSEGGESLGVNDVYEGIAWILPWANLGFEEDPFINYDGHGRTICE